jgi:anti-sigma B factor antagonist
VESLRGGDPLARAGAGSGRRDAVRAHSMDDYANIDIDIVEYDELVVVAVEGEVDLSAAPLFEESLAIAGATEATAIILDLDRVSFMDSAGVHVLLQFSLSEANRDRLSLTGASPQVRRLLELTGVRRYLSFLRSPAPAHNGGPPASRLRLTAP